MKGRWMLTILLAATIAAAAPARAQNAPPAETLPGGAPAPPAMSTEAPAMSAEPPAAAPAPPATTPPPAAAPGGTSS